MDRFTRRLIMRVAAVALALIGVLVYPHCENLWNSMRSPCAKAWTVKDVAALAGGSWERGALYHCKYFCNQSFGEVNAQKYTAFLDVNQDIGSPEADSWLKDLKDVRPLSEGVSAGIDDRFDRKERVAVIRRPKGAIRIQLDATRFTDEHLRKAVEQLTPHLADFDRYLAGD